MNEHALDAMIYAWMVMKEKEESSMEGIYVGKVKRSRADKDSVDLSFVDHRQDVEYFGKVIDYDDTAYCLVTSDDCIINNDELLKLRDEVKALKTKNSMLEAANADQAKNFLAMTKSRDYFEEKADSVEKKYEELVAEHTKLQAELMEIKTYRNLREAYIAGVEKGCESLREERDYWKDRFGSVVTDVRKVLESNGVEFTVKAIDGNKWNVGIDIPELNEAKAKVADLEKKLADSKSKEEYWRDRKEEEEDYHHYWLHTYDRVVKQAADKGIHIDVRGTDEDCNAGVVVVDNVKATDLEKQVVQMEDANQKLRKRISAADEDIEKLKNREGIAYWRNTYYSAVEKAKEEGVTIVMQGMDLDANVAHLKVTNHRAAGFERQIKRLEYDNSAKSEALVNAKDRGDYWLRECGLKNNMYQELEAKHDAKWSAMLQALKDKGVEVIYMDEEDGKPIVDVKISGLGELKEQCDILRKDGVLKRQQCLKLTEDLNALKKEYGRVLSELADLKSKTIAEARYEWKPNCFTLIYTMCDGSDQTFCMDSSEAISATAISCGTVPKCSSCVYYMHNPSRFAHDWCYKPVSKERTGTIRRLSKEEAEGPACSDFKARKE